MIVYIETNFIIGAAAGRDPYCDDLLRIPSDDLRVVMPGACVMEACTWIEGERTRRREFGRALARQAHEMGRDRTSAYAGSLRDHVSAAAIENERVLNDTEVRFHRVLLNLAGEKVRDESIVRRAEFLPLGSTWETNLLGPVPNQPTDNLILSVIGAHARENPAERKVLLSGNSTDFNKPEVQALLRECGITDYFTRTDAFLGWYNSLPPSTPAP